MVHASILPDLGANVPKTCDGNAVFGFSPARPGAMPIVSANVWYIPAGKMHCIRPLK